MVVYFDVQQTPESKGVKSLWSLNPTLFGLDFGLNYHGEIIDEFTVEVMEDFLFDYAPRKVSVAYEPTIRAMASEPAQNGGISTNWISGKKIRLTPVSVTAEP